MKKLFVAVFVLFSYALGAPAQEGAEREIVIDMSDADRSLHNAGQEPQRVIKVLRAADIDVGVDPDRAYLGIAIEGDSASGDKGVRILAVTPGGPADKAGLRAGDVITAINGQALEGTAGQSAAKSLFAVMRGVKVGEAVNVEYLRGQERLSAEVVTDRFTGHAMMRQRMPETSPVPPVPGAYGHGEGHGDDDHFFAHHGPKALQGLELAALSPGLGEYFGTGEGVLVLNAPEGIALESGDVIKRIGDRVPKDPVHAYRILASYEPGEKAELTILRKKEEKTVSLQW